MEWLCTSWTVSSSRYQLLKFHFYASCKRWFSFSSRNHHHYGSQPKLARDMKDAVWFEKREKTFSDAERKRQIPHAKPNREGRSPSTNTRCRRKAARVFCARYRPLRSSRFMFRSYPLLVINFFPYFSSSRIVFLYYTIYSKRYARLFAERKEEGFTSHI